MLARYCGASHKKQKNKAKERAEADILKTRDQETEGNAAAPANAAPTPAPAAHAPAAAAHAPAAAASEAQPPAAASRHFLERWWANRP